jgi:hypothetical protein
MSVWRVKKGESFIFEGTVMFATAVGTGLYPFPLSGATLVWHLGSTLQPPMYTRSMAGGTNWSYGTALGTWTFTGSPADTEGLSATNYYYDIWLGTAGGKEYCLTVGTFIVESVVGTI